MRYFDGMRPAIRAIWTTTGIITTTMGVLFMKAEAMATTPSSIAMARLGLDFAASSAALISRSSAPVRTSAPMTMNIAAMVQGAGFDRTSRPAS
jgi:hypothetical protein